MGYCLRTKYSSNAQHKLFVFLGSLVQALLYAVEATTLKLLIIDHSKHALQEHRAADGFL